MKQEALDFINTKLPWIWPAAFDTDPVTGAKTFKWDLLVDPLNRTGPDRLDAQFWRANIDPSELYVLSVTDTSRLRLAPDDSDFDNLLLAGDYTRNGINAGCMEAAIISGLIICRKLTGLPKVIVGLGDGLV